jgi:hypothetical protein
MLTPRCGAVQSPDSSWGILARCARNSHAVARPEFERGARSASHSGTLGDSPTCSSLLQRMDSASPNRASCRDGAFHLAARWAADRATALDSGHWVQGRIQLRAF